MDATKRNNNAVAVVAHGRFMMGRHGGHCNNNNNHTTTTTKTTTLLRYNYNYNSTLVAGANNNRWGLLPRNAVQDHVLASKHRGSGSTKNTATRPRPRPRPRRRGRGRCFRSKP